MNNHCAVLDRVRHPGGSIQTALDHGKHEVLQLADDLVVAAKFQFRNFEQTQSVVRLILQGTLPRLKYEIEQHLVAPYTQGSDVVAHRSEFRKGREVIVVSLHQYVVTQLLGQIMHKAAHLVTLLQKQTHSVSDIFPACTFLYYFGDIHS